MSVQQNILGLIDPRGQSGRAAMIWMKLLHQGSVGADDFLRPAPFGRPRIHTPRRATSPRRAARRPAARASPCSASRQPANRRSRYASSSARLRDRRDGNRCRDRGIPAASGVSSARPRRAGEYARRSSPGLAIEPHLDRRRAGRRDRDARARRQPALRNGSNRSRPAASRRSSPPSWRAQPRARNCRAGAADSAPTMPSAPPPGAPAAPRRPGHARRTAGSPSRQIERRTSPTMKFDRRRLSIRTPRRGPAAAPSSKRSPELDYAKFSRASAPAAAVRVGSAAPAPRAPRVRPRHRPPPRAVASPAGPPRRRRRRHRRRRSAARSPETRAARAGSCALLEHERLDAGEREFASQRRLACPASSSIASPTNTSAPTLARFASSRA